MPANPLEVVKINFPEQPVEMNFVFCEHNKAKSLPSIFAELATEADIVALETVGWSSEGAKLRQDIANGDKEALRYMSSLLPVSPQGGFWRKVHRDIFDTTAQLHYPEAPQNHPVANAYIAAAQRESLAIGVRSISTSNVPHENLTPMLAEMFSSIAERDAYILGHLFPDMLTKQEGKIRYLGMFGLLHRGLANMVTQQAEIQDRPDITVVSHESGSVNPVPYENYLRGVPPTIEDVTSYYGLRLID